MYEKILISAVTFCLTWPLRYCFFFHEPSAVLLPSPDVSGDFGFSLGYHQKNLIVGDPRSSIRGFGEIRSCALDLSTNINCSHVNIDVNTRNYSYALNANQNFFMGATIAATKDYIFTCAPMATLEVKNKNNFNVTDAIGACFIYYNNGSSYNFKGPIENYLLSMSNNTDLMTGGTGWNSLVDEVNGFLLIAKPSLYGDIKYLKLQNPLNLAKSAREGNKYIKAQFKRNYNIGYGLAEGHFFSKNTVVYAVSMQTAHSMSGEIIFLQAHMNILNIKMRSGSVVLKITHRAVNAMFGYALTAADFNLDGLSELLVGAPAHSDDGDKVESGALHIYLGGQERTIQDQNRMRSIYADTENGRFGTTIATSDIDGDNIPEVFVSAPYEDTGVVYVLSGYELQSKLFSSAKYKQIYLSQLKHSQRIKHEGLRQFGFSIQVVPDLDGNGCNELAIGAPASSSVLLLRSFQTVKVTIELTGPQIIKVEQKDFNVSVCLRFKYNSITANAMGRIEVTNNIEGPGVSIPYPDIIVDFNKTLPELCKNITVKFHRDGPGAYKFITSLKMNEKYEAKDFNKLWAVLSPYGNRTKTLPIVRQCSKDNECNPKLTLDVYSTIKTNNYTLGSSETEKVTVVVMNEGGMAYGASLLIQVSGALVSRIYCSGNGGRYHCSIPKLPQTNHTIEMVLNMTGRSNLDEALTVKAKLYENYNENNATSVGFLKKPYSLSLQQDQVYLKAISHAVNITDKELSDTTIDFIIDSHDYLITNNGSITWEHLAACIHIENNLSFIKQVKTTEPESCEYVNLTDTSFVINCNLTLKPGSSKKIAALMYMSKQELGKHLANGYVFTRSHFDLRVTSSEKRNQTVESTLMLRVEITLKNNKTAILIIASLIAFAIWAIIAIILWQTGFFKRKQKERLDELRASIRKRSIRQASEARQSQKNSVEGTSGLAHVEVVDDIVFEEEPCSPVTNDTRR